jgi:hypothetical protein
MHQEAGEIPGQASEWKQLLDHGVVVWYEAKDASRRRVCSPWERQQEHIGSLSPLAHCFKRGQNQVTTRKPGIEGRNLEITRRSHLIERRRHKSGKNLAIAKNK